MQQNTIMPTIRAAPTTAPTMMPANALGEADPASGVPSVPDVDVGFAALELEEGAEGGTVGRFGKRLRATLGSIVAA